MKDMALLSVVRRWAFRDGMLIRKYLRSDAVEPKFRIVIRPSRLDPYADRLAG